MEAFHRVSLSGHLLGDLHREHPQESPPGPAPRSLPRRIPLRGRGDTTSPEHLPCRGSSELSSRKVPQGGFRTVSSSEVSCRGSPDGGSSRASPRRSHRYSPPPGPFTAAPSRRSRRGERPLEAFPPVSSESAGNVSHGASTRPFPRGRPSLEAALRSLYFGMTFRREHPSSSPEDALGAPLLESTSSPAPRSQTEGPPGDLSR